MTEKKLTNKGVEDIEKIEGVDEIEEIEYTKKEPESLPMSIIEDGMVKKSKVEKPKPTRQEAKEIIKQANEDPEAKRVGAKVMKKSTYVMIWITIGFLVLLLIWANTIFSLKDLSPNNNFTINNNPKIDTTIPIDNYINFTIINENKIEIPQDIINNMTNEIVDKILFELNLTNST